MVETTPSLAGNVKQVAQSFGFVIFSFVADVISIVIAVQQQQVGQTGFALLALFFTALVIAQILSRTWQKSKDQHSPWPLMVGIVFSAGMLALCSRVWSGSNWWQWVLISLLIPVISLVFISWRYNKASQNMQRLFTLDILGHWFGFAALGFIADLITIVGAVTIPQFEDAFTAVGLILTLLVVAIVLYTTNRESYVSNFKGPVIVGTFAATGLTVAYLYVWIDVVLWESLVFNTLILSLALIAGLLRCAFDQPGNATPGTGGLSPKGVPPRKSAKRSSKGPKTTPPKETNPHRPPSPPQPGFQNLRQSGEDSGTHFGYVVPKSPPPNPPVSPSFRTPDLPENLPQTNQADPLQLRVVDLSQPRLVSTPQVAQGQLSIAEKQAIRARVQNTVSREKKHNEKIDFSSKKIQQTYEKKASQIPVILSLLQSNASKGLPDHQLGTKQQPSSTESKPLTDFGLLKDFPHLFNNNAAASFLPARTELLRKWLLEKSFGFPVTQTPAVMVPQKPKPTAFPSQTEFFDQASGEKLPFDARRRIEAKGKNDQDKTMQDRDLYQFTKRSSQVTNGVPLPQMPRGKSHSEKVKEHHKRIIFDTLVERVQPPTQSATPNENFNIPFKIDWIRNHPEPAPQNHTDRREVGNFDIALSEDLQAGKTSGRLGNFAQDHPMLQTLGEGKKHRGSLAQYQATQACNLQPRYINPPATYFTSMEKLPATATISRFVTFLPFFLRNVKR